MRIVVFLLLTILLSSNLQIKAQSLSDFEVLIKLKSSPLKNQQSSGTCWSFATTSFIETEALRLGKETISISPMFYVKPAYMGKAAKFIESKGESWFNAGDLTFSVLEGYKKFGAIPEQVYTGIIKEDWQHDHLEMDELLRAMVESIGTSGYGRIKPNSWKMAVEGTLNAYIGIVPSIFYFNDKLYSPKTFASEYIGINPEDYIEITSFTQANFNEMFVLDIPANWNNNKYLNVSITAFENIINHALMNGFSLAWDGDATEPHFNFEAGILKLSEQEEVSIISQEMRQKAFEDENTTDDHNMHIIGKAKKRTR